MTEANYDWSRPSTPVFCHGMHKDEFAIKLSAGLQNNKHAQQRKNL
jgi:hypothetical protein